MPSNKACTAELQFRYRNEGRTRGLYAGSERPLFRVVAGYRAELDHQDERVGRSHRHSRPPRTQAKFKDRYVSSFLSGSYARDTSIRPRTSSNGQERPDVDIIVVTNFTSDDHPDAVLKEVCRALEDGGDGYEVERINKRSVRVENWQADMDIVPVIETWNGYQIADRDSGTWKFTNPPVHTSWSSDQNERFGSASSLW